MKKHFLKLLNFTFILTALLIVFTFGISAATVVEDMPAGDDLYFRIVEENGGQTMEFYGEGTALKAVHSETGEYLTPGYNKYIAASTNNYKNSSHYQYRTTVTKIRFLTPNLTSFFDYYFHTFNNVTELELHANITKLTDGAFNGIKAITTVYTTGQTRVEGTADLSNITTLGSYTFCDNKFSKIIFSSSTTYVGDQTFKGCTNLTSLELPAAIASAHSNAFKGCTGVTTLTVYNNAIDVSKFAGGLTGLTTIVANPGSSAETYANANGKTFDIVKHPAGEGVFFRVIPENGSYTMEISGDGTTLQALDSTGAVLKGGYSYTTANYKNSTHYAHKDNVTKVKFLTPNLTTISGYYFYNFRKIAEVEFHSGMKSISSEAFCGVTAIKTIYTTGQTPEVGTANLTNFSSLGDYALVGNLFEKIIFGNEITKLGTEVFQKCQSLKSIELPENITFVNSKTFKDCSGVTSVTVYNKELNMSFAASLTSLTTVIGYSGSTAETYADENGKTFEAFGPEEYPAGEDLYFRILEENGSYTMEIFGDGTTLQAVNASTGEYIGGGYNSFIGNGGCRNSTHWAYRSQVTKVRFLTPKLTTISGYYFYDFRKIAEVEFDPGMTTISDEAFLGITAITTIYTTGQTRVEGTANLSNFSNIGNYTFSGNLFERIVFGDKITWIGNEVFKGCTKLVSLELPSTIGIHSSAFKGCTGVKTLTVYSDTLAISGFAAEFTGLTTVIGHSGSPAWTYAKDNGKTFVPFEYPAGEDVSYRIVIEDDVYVMEIFGEGTAMTAYNADGEALTGTYKAYVEGGAYNEATHYVYQPEVTKVRYLTPNLTTFPGYYFYNFKLTEIELHPDMKTLSQDTFNGVKAATAVYTTGQTPEAGVANLSNLSSIGSYCFQRNLFTKIIFGSEIKSIGYQIFYGCTALESIELPANITGVNSTAFQNCTGVKTLTVENTKMNIADFAAALTGLTKVNGYFGSTAYDYAKENDKAFGLLGADGILTFEGFQIREKEYNGLRSLFSANVSGISELTEMGFEVVELGSIIASSEKLVANGDELTVSYNGDAVTTHGYAVKIAVIKDGALTDVNVLGTSDETTVNYACTITNYTQDTYDKDATFRGYMVLKDADGNSYVYYADLTDSEGELYNTTSLDKMVEKFENDGTIDITNNVCYVDVKKFRENSIN